MDISVVIPLYNSEESISLLYQLLINAIYLYNNYEIIFIDDNSKDNTLEIIKGISNKDPHIRILKFKKHMGQYEALFFGYKCSRGKIVINLDDDAFNEVKFIPNFIGKIEEGYDIVLGWRDKSECTFFRRISSFVFNAIISAIIGKRIHDIGSSLKARNRRAVNGIVSRGDFLSFLQCYKYYRVAELKISHKYSQEFPTRYNIIKLLKMALLIFRKNVFNKNKYSANFFCKNDY